MPFQPHNLNIMYKAPKYTNKMPKINQSTEGETIEMKIERIVSNKEPIKDGAPIIYTERSEGVKEAYDIRTDRFEIAVEAMDKVAKSHQATRQENANKRKEKSAETEPIHGKTDTAGTEPE